jgi:hypothetical protein
VSSAGSAALTSVMDTDHEHPEITDRLRSLGRQPVDPHVAATHLASLPSTRRRRPLAPLVVGVAAGLLLLALAFVPGAVRDDGTPVAADVAEAPADVAEVRAQDPGDPAPGRPEGVGPPRAGDDPCGGPPPWAGGPPEGATPEERAEARARDVAEWRAQRETARANGECDGPRGLGRPSWAGPHREGRGPCQGPPPFAGGPPPGDTDEARDAARQAQVEQWKAQRQADGCPVDEDD